MPESGASTSLWIASVTPIRLAPLDRNVVADVCVVGGGISGLTTTWLLAREGLRVVLLEALGIGSGMTGRTTAHLCNAVDDRYYKLEQMHGADGARLVADSHTAAVDLIERIVHEEGIDCDFERVDGYLIVPPGDPLDELERERGAALRAGIVGVEIVGRAPFESFHSGPALRFPRQAQFHPMKYLAGLTQACTRLGVQIFTDTRATRIEGGSEPRVGAGGYVVSCDAIVVATCSPVVDRVLIHTKQHPYQTYVIGALVPAGSVPHVLCWDTPDPYHYLRVHAAMEAGEQPGYDVLIVGGEDHRTGQEDDGEHRYLALEQWTRERFPMVTDIAFRWSGEVFEPADSLAHIGADPMAGDNVYVATGDSGNGLTHGTIAGILLTDLILGRQNPWAALYNPMRLGVTSAPAAWITENVNMALQYSEWIPGGDVSSVDELAPGEGAVVQRGLLKVAAYRRPDGSIVECSAVCVHLGGIVAWNSSERTWDCPCHGSRFDAEGRVFQGPANADLPLASRTAVRPPQK